MRQRVPRLRLLERQIARLDGRILQLQARADRLTVWRLVSFAAAFVVGGAVLLTAGPVWWVMATFLLLVPFALLVRGHRQLEAAVGRHAVWRDHKRAQLARMRLDWEQMPPGQPVPERLEHPFALDLDLLGERSLHRLLDTAVSQEGSDRLRDWLLATEPDPARTLQRQAVVVELSGMDRFRDRLVLHATLATGKAAAAQKWPGRRLLDWLQARSDPAALRTPLLLLAALVPLNFGLLALNLAGMLPPLWFGTWLLYGVIAILQLPRTEPAFRDASYLSDSLLRLNAVFAFLEQYPYRQHVQVAALCASFLAVGERPSRYLKRAGRLIAMAGLRYNPLVSLLLNAAVPWDVFTAYRLEQFKAALGDRLPHWLDVWFELEALSSLANVAYLNPSAHFPELLVEDGTADIRPFVALQIGHPLIPAEERISNDYSVPHVGAISLITGSNMAGKSSFLRTLGVNVCLALAGGPVLADALRMRPLRLFASIRVSDSVTDGYSFFYAEVRRLKWLLDELGRDDATFPLFFLIDEIFRGTNNRERLIGSRGYVRALVGRNGIGAIATHDLELVKLADESTAVANYHFRDAVEAGKMVFDYRLHAGPCPTTNALKIMALAGLPVDGQDAER